MSKFSDGRSFITAGLARRGASGLGAAVYLADRYGLVPPISGIVVGESITYASQTFITRAFVGREFKRMTFRRSQR